MEEELPGLKEIEEKIASLSVSEAIARIRGAKAAADFHKTLAALQKERAEVLRSGGYSETDLVPEYECKKCRDTGYVNGSLCSCFKEKITDVLYDQSGIKDVLKEENFETATLRYYPEGPALDAARLAHETAHRFVDNFASSEENLFITGQAGVGKTFLTNCIARELLDAGYFVVYLSAIRLFEILSEAAFGSYGNEMAQASGEYIRKHIYDCDLLIIDDLGTELVNTFTTTQLFNCINERILRKKHTIISTNLSLKQLLENYSERIFSRIANKYTLIRLLGNDIRMLKRLEEN